ncbi:Golgi reassembly-stacking protein 2-like isoform X2 [Homarus americanus]|uniref:Golgi reassembly-stacking protein 2-like isoform X2 n=1 Tax=Homarus americanus TaxID=6706 RepID=UPI001C4889F4|nr:Golgi reassembly-stacking protein 2-like isoform X2 [Homarus americanus]
MSPLYNGCDVDYLQAIARFHVEYCCKDGEALKFLHEHCNQHCSYKADKHLLYCGRSLLSKVQENSPGQLAGLEAFFDFVVSIGNTRLDQDNDTLKELLKNSIEKELKMTVYSSKTQTIRTVNITPSNLWGGQGLLGVSIRFCSFEGANENVWHILEVEPNSPADIAGLQSYKDYIIGADSVLHESEDLFSLIEAHEGRPLKLYVYNVETDSCREVTVSPDTQWGGSGSLGCGIGYGYLHRIPTQRGGPITDTPKRSPGDSSDTEPLLQVATGDDIGALTTGVGKMNTTEGVPATMTAGSTIPPPTAFTAAPDSHPAFATATATAATTAAIPAASAAVPNIPPPAAFTPASVPPPVELPASFTSPTSTVPPQVPYTTCAPSSVQVPVQTPSEVPVATFSHAPAQTLSMQAPIQAPNFSPSPSPNLPPVCVPQLSPLTMGGAPTVPVMSSGIQMTGGPEVPAPAGPVPPPVPVCQPVPLVSQYYSSPVIPPPVPPPTFTGTPTMPSIPGMPVTTPITLPGMPPITVSATLPPESFQGIPSNPQTTSQPQPVQ